MMLDEKFVIQSIEKYLENDGWRLIRKGERKKRAELAEIARQVDGIDIIAEKNEENYYLYFIEAKGEPGEKAKNPLGQREKSVTGAIGQIISCMPSNYWWYKYGVAFPANDDFRRLVEERIPTRIRKLLNLDIFFIDEEGNVEIIGIKQE